MRALRLYERFLPNDDEKIAELYFSMGNNCKQTNYKSEKLRFYNKALEIFQKDMEKNQNEVAQIYINLGEIYKEENSEKCEAFYMDALNISKEYPKIENYVLFTMYYELGNLCMERGANDQSLELLLSAEEILKANEDNSLLADLHHILADSTVVYEYNKPKEE